MTTLVDRPNAALLVIDMQNGVVAGAPNLDQVVANIQALVGRARSAGWTSCGCRASGRRASPGARRSSLCARSWRRRTATRCGCC